jgi:hypothetical protein
MRQRLLLVLMLGLASLGAECSDGGGAGAAGQSSTPFTVSFDETGPSAPPSDEQPAPSVPEPSAALVFGAGLLVAGLVSRQRNR